MILLRELDGIDVVEYRIAERGWTEACEEWADDISEELFGIVDEDTRPWTDDQGRFFVGGIEVDDASQREARCVAWEAHFAPLKLFRDESDAFWAAHGWDVTDGKGRQLEIMRRIGRPLLCAALKLHPDATLPGVGLDKWEADLE